MPHVKGGNRHRETLRRRHISYGRLHVVFLFLFFVLVVAPRHGLRTLVDDFARFVCLPPIATGPTVQSSKYTVHTYRR